MKKDQHIEYALECNSVDSLKDIRLKYNSLANLELDDIDISTEFCGIKFTYPIYINAMTGGSYKADKINKRLENISNKLGIFVFNGSYSPNLKENKWYYIKNQGANIGADKNIENMKKTVKETNAKILQIHLNPIQELLMIDGDTNFKDWKYNIRKAIEEIDIPIIIKETGFGMSTECIQQLITLGVKTIDISAKGGTNFAYIEDKRAKKDRAYMYELGYNLKESLFNSLEYMDNVEILASGGIENPLQVVKCLSLGAKAVGMSSYILKLLQKYDDDEKVISNLQEFITQIKKIMIIINAKNLQDLKNKWEVI